jgi:hypothetical protein
MTDINLGPYARDPRVAAETTYVSVPTRDATIMTGNDGRSWWVRINGENVFSGKLIKVLEDLLGDPMRVGPVGIREWLHTDDFVILGDKVNIPDALGQWTMVWPVQRIVTGVETTWSPRSGDMVPIRFAR